MIRQAIACGILLIAPIARESRANPAECSSITDESARLACYDQLAGIQTDPSSLTPAIEAKTSAGGITARALRDGRMTEGPSLGSSTLVEFEVDTEVQVSGYENEHYRCTVGGMTGYISTMHLDLFTPGESLDRLTALRDGRSEGTVSVGAHQPLYYRPYRASGVTATRTKQTWNITGARNGCVRLERNGQVRWLQAVLDTERLILASADEVTAVPILQPFQITMAAPTVPDSAGGAGLRIGLRVGGEKAIKYLRLGARAYNDVGDAVRSSTSGSTDANFRLTGPLNYEDERFHSFEIGWYNSTITCVKILKVTVDYMDGSSYTYINELNKVLHPDMSNECRARE